MSDDTGLTYYDVDEAMQPIVTRLAVGRNRALEDQLMAKSRQDNIQKFTPNDLTKRFGDREMLEAWFAKDRVVHWLLGDNDDLAGIIWYGPSAMPVDVLLPEQPTETFAIRIYDGYAGHGLARPFMTLSLKTHVAEKQKASQPLAGIWLQTDIDNPAAVAAYVKFGYQEVHRDEKRVTMILPTAAILELC